MTLLEAAEQVVKAWNNQFLPSAYKYDVMQSIVDLSRSIEAEKLKQKESEK